MSDKPVDPYAPDIVSAMAVTRLERVIEQQADEMAALRLRIKAVEDIATLWQIQVATESAKHRHTRLRNMPDTKEG